MVDKKEIWNTSAPGENVGLSFKRWGAMMKLVLAGVELFVLCWVAVAEVKASDVTDVLCLTSVARQRIDFSVGLSDDGLLCGRSVSLRAEVRHAEDPTGPVAATFESDPFPYAASRRTFGGEWRNPRLWTPDEPANLYAVTVSVLDGGRVVSSFGPETFGFREVKASGRDLLFNGYPFHARVAKTTMPGSADITDEEIRDTCRKLKAKGYNMFFASGNYGYDEKRLPSFARTISLASEEGLCFAVALPEPAGYRELKEATNWVFTADLKRRQAEVVRRLQNIPGLILWAGTMNCGIYAGDLNPLAATGRAEDMPKVLLPRVSDSSERRIAQVIRRGEEGAPARWQKKFLAHTISQGQAPPNQRWSQSAARV